MGKRQALREATSPEGLNNEPGVPCWQDPVLDD